MRLSDALDRTRGRRTARVLGRRAALGLAEPIDLVPDARTEAWAVASACRACGAPGRVELLDLAGGLVHLGCERCGAVWHVPVPADAERAPRPE